MPQHPSSRLSLRPGRLLGRRSLQLLAAQPAPQPPHRPPSSLRPLRLRLPLSLPLAHFLFPSLSLFPSLRRPTCPPCPLHVSHPPLCLSLTNRPAPCPLHAFYLLGPRLYPRSPTPPPLGFYSLDPLRFYLEFSFCHSMGRFFTSCLKYTL